MPKNGLIFVIFTFLAVLIKAELDVPPEIREQFNQLHKLCLAQQKLTEDDFKKMDVTKKEPKVMCYVRCAFITFKVMDENENVQVDFIKKNTHPSLKHVLLPNLDKCAPKAVGSAKCEKAYNFYGCMRKGDPESWALI